MTHPTESKQPFAPTALFPRDQLITPLSQPCPVIPQLYRQIVPFQIPPVAKKLFPLCYLPLGTRICINDQLYLVRGVQDRYLWAGKENERDVFCFDSSDSSISPWLIFNYNQRVYARNPKTNQYEEGRMMCLDENMSIGEIQNSDNNTETEEKNPLERIIRRAEECRMKQLEKTAHSMMILFSTDELSGYPAVSIPRKDIWPIDCMLLPIQPIRPYSGSPIFLDFIQK